MAQNFFLDYNWCTGIDKMHVMIIRQSLGHEIDASRIQW